MFKNFPVYNNVSGRYESSLTENGKNHLRLNHRVLTLNSSRSYNNGEPL